MELNKLEKLFIDYYDELRIISRIRKELHRLNNANDTPITLHELLNQVEFEIWDEIESKKEEKITDEG